MKSFAEYLALLGNEAPDQLAPRDSAQLAGALLDGGVADIELGALVATLRLRANSAVLLDGLVTALRQRVNRWHCGSARHAPVAIGCYGGNWNVPNLTPLLGLLLARFGIPVIMHGPLHAEAGVSTAIVLRALGIMPCVHREQVASELENRRIAFVPDALVAPGLASLLALAARIGPTPLFSTAGRLIDPFNSGGLVTAWAVDADELDLMRSVVAVDDARVLLLYSAHSQGYARAMLRPHIEMWFEGKCELLFEEDSAPERSPAPVCDLDSAAATAVWIQQAYDGTRAIPVPLLSQIAACLYATGYCDNLNQAKAFAVVATANRQVA
jgi:anthranilate phosphoribosyltransferase